MLDAGSLSEPFDLVALVTATEDGMEDGTRQIGPCGLPLLPAEKIAVEFEGGALHLDVRKKDARLAAYHRAALVGTRLRLGGESAHITDPARLTYDSTRHAFSESFLVVPPEPLGDVHAVELAFDEAGARASIALLDADLAVLREPPVTSILRMREVDGLWRVGLPWAGAGSGAAGGRRWDVRATVPPRCHSRLVCILDAATAAPQGCVCIPVSRGIQCVCGRDSPDRAVRAVVRRFTGS